MEKKTTDQQQNASSVEASAKNQRKSISSKIPFEKCLSQSRTEGTA
jgi:hypothetical protein